MPSPSRTRMLAITTVIAAACGTVAPIHAAPPPIDSETVRLLVADLDSDSYHNRESATRSIAALPVSLEEFVEALPDDLDLAPEQAVRLDEALFVRFRETPRAGLGVQMEGPTEGRGIALARIIETFPASEFLESADIVIAVDGVEVTYPETLAYFQASIVSRDPGQALDLKVLRDGEVLDLRVPLGRFSDLNQNGAIRSDVLTNAWDLRRARLGLALQNTDVIRPANAPAVWPVGQAPRAHRENPNILAGGRPFTQPGYAWSGESDLPRGLVRPDGNRLIVRAELNGEQQLEAIRNARLEQVRRLTEQRQAAQQAAQEAAARAADPEIVRRETIIMLRAAISEYDVRLRTVKAQLEALDLNDAQREAFKAQARQYEAMRINLEKRLATLLEEQGDD
ncbi:MAG: PDZ domain-containing protein [Planctomycetota bacterium]|nr:PDZ domain-containing protein [Planctomycetota bacterium]